MDIEQSLLSRRYRLDGVLGSGGSATVYAAVDLETGSRIAVKVLHPHLRDRPAACALFLDEARRAAGLRHPNIVEVIAAGRDTSTEPPSPWIALQLADGSTLTEHVARHGALTPATAIAVIGGVLRALEFVHGAGLIHRDVSPSNVMVAPDGDGGLDGDGVRLLDFGLAQPPGRTARAPDELLNADATGATGVMGNVNYMPPEQLRGQAVDARGDVYQAGAVLYFALTGRPPYRGGTTEQTIRGHLEAPVPIPSLAGGAGIPRALDRIVHRALRKDPDERYASAAATRRALAAIAASAAAAPAVPANAPDAADILVTCVLPLDAADAADTAATAATTILTNVPGSAPRLPYPRRRGPRATRPRHAASAWAAAVVAAAAIGVTMTLASTAAPTAISASPLPAAAAADEQAPATTPTQPPAPPTRPPEAARVTMPDLSRMSAEAALALLHDLGLELGSVTHVDSPQPRDTVLSADRAAGDPLDRGMRISLTLASGWNAVPDVIGIDREAALAAIVLAGLHPDPAPAVSRPVSETSDELVIALSPAPGQVVAVGSTVRATLAAPARDPAPPRTPAPTRSPSPAPTPTPTPSDGAPGDG